MTVEQNPTYFGPSICNLYLFKEQNSVSELRDDVYSQWFPNWGSRPLGRGGEHLQGEQTTAEKQRKQNRIKRDEIAPCRAAQGSSGQAKRQRGTETDRRGRLLLTT